MITWFLPSSLNFFYRPKDDLYHVFLSRVGRRVSIILLQLFSPIYIFQIAKNQFSSEATAVLIVLAYYLLMAIVKFIVTPLSENLSQKIGFKGIIWASAIPFFLFIPGIVYAKNVPSLLIISSILFGIHSAFYWWGYHGYFVKTADRKHFGRSVGEARLLETIASVITPFAGAIITSFFGFTALFVTTAVVVYISLLLLGRYHDKKQKRDVKYVDVLKLIKSHKSVSLAYVGYGGEFVVYSVVDCFISLFLFGNFCAFGRRMG
jgi:predicted MFS family arabinose efflux permease